MYLYTQIVELYIYSYLHVMLHECTQPLYLFELYNSTYVYFFMQTLAYEWRQLVSVFNVWTSLIIQVFSPIFPVVIIHPFLLFCRLNVFLISIITFRFAVWQPRLAVMICHQLSSCLFQIIVSLRMVFSLAENLADSHIVNQEMIYWFIIAIYIPR